MPSASRGMSLAPWEGVVSEEVEVHAQRGNETLETSIVLYKHLYIIIESAEADLGNNHSHTMDLAPTKLDPESYKPLFRCLDSELA